MSYSALTELGVDPICPACEERILPAQKIALVLVTTAEIVPSYNEENELDHVDTTTADMNFTDQVAFHFVCMQRAAHVFLENG